MAFAPPASRLEDFESARALVAGASGPADVFGDASDTEAARRRYRQLAFLLHPDHAVPTEHAAAAVATARLNLLWDQFKRGVGGAIAVTSKRFTYSVGPLAAGDELSNLYGCSWEHDGARREGVLRLPRDPRNNDLVAAEARALKRLDAGEARFRNYAPVLVDSFRYRDSKTAVTRQAVVIEPIAGAYSLAQVAEAYPGGIGGRDAAWMWRRLLAGAGWAHRAGLVHGAILPENILIVPESHGVVFTNWCYSATDGARIPAMVSRYADWYPPSVAAKEPARPAVDIHMIARCMVHLLGPRASRSYRAFARGCTTPGLVLDDAWEIQREFDQLLERLYGRRRFVPFYMPA